MAIENFHTVTGVIFSKVVKTGKSKRPLDPDWKLCIVNIEAKVLVNGKSVVSVCEFVFDWNVSFDEFYDKDIVSASFYFANKTIKKKDGTNWVKEEKRIASMKLADINNPRSNRPPVIKTEEEKIFTPPVEGEQSDIEEDLPF